MMREVQGKGIEGFTLVETLVALALIAVVVIPSSVALNRMLAHDNRMAKEILARRIAYDALERNSLYCSMQGDSGGFTAFSISPDGAFAVSETAKRDAQTGLMRVSVSVRRVADGDSAKPVAEVSRLVIPGAEPADAAEPNGGAG